MEPWPHAQCGGGVTGTGEWGQQGSIHSKLLIVIFTVQAPEPGLHISIYVHKATSGNDGMRSSSDGMRSTIITWVQFDRKKNK